MCKTEYIIGIIKDNKENKNKINTTLQVLSLLHKLLHSSLIGDFIIVYKEGAVDEIIEYANKSKDSKLLCLITTNHIGYKLKNKYSIIQIRNHKYKILNTRYNFDLWRYSGITLPYNEFDFEPNSLIELLDAINERLNGVLKSFPELNDNRFSNIYKYLKCINTDWHYCLYSNTRSNKKG